MTDLKWGRAWLRMKTLLAPILAALILMVGPTGSQEKHGEIVGSAVFMNSETGEFADNAPNVTLELEFKGRSIRLRFDEFAVISKTLPAGTYCLKSAHDANNKPPALRLTNTSALRL